MTEMITIPDGRLVACPRYIWCSECLSRGLRRLNSASDKFYWFYPCSLTLGRRSIAAHIDNILTLAARSQLVASAPSGWRMSRRFCDYCVDCRASALALPWASEGTRTLPSLPFRAGWRAAFWDTRPTCSARWARHRDMFYLSNAADVLRAPPNAPAALHSPT